MPNAIKMGIDDMILEIKNYCTTYDKKRWFSYPTIDLKGGKCVCIMGSSGCGKTTLLNSLFGLSFSGKCKYDKALILEKDIKLWGKDKYKYISYMPQFAQHGLNPCITVSEHIEYILKNNDNVADNNTISYYFDKLELGENIKDLYPKEISGGMKQRVVLLMSFIKRPKLLVLDEPSSALDYITLRNMVDFINERKSEGCGILLVSHDKNFAKALSDKIINLGI